MVPVTRDVALHHTGTFYHIWLKNADGTPVRCRANGACKTWKTRPHDYRLPVKYGLQVCFYITSANSMDWEITENDWEWVRRCLLCNYLSVAYSIHNDALYDLAVENGLEDATVGEICKRERSYDQR